MIRVCLTGWLVFILLAGLSFARAAHADYHPGDCTWSEQGDVITISGTEYHCACGRLTRSDGHTEVFCRWHAVAGAATRRRIVVKRHKPLFGISTAVISKIAVAS